MAQRALIWVLLSLLLSALLYGALLRYQNREQLNSAVLAVPVLLNLASAWAIGLLGSGTNAHFRTRVLLSSVILPLCGVALYVAAGMLLSGVSP